MWFLGLSRRAAHTFTIANMPIVLIGHCRHMTKVFIILWNQEGFPRLPVFWSFHTMSASHFRFFHSCHSVSWRQVNGAREIEILWDILGITVFKREKPLLILYSTKLDGGYSHYSILAPRTSPFIKGILLTQIDGIVWYRGFEAYCGFDTPKCRRGGNSLVHHFFLVFSTLDLSELSL